MTIAQAERFYEQDEKKYIVSKNKELLCWFRDAVKKGYNSFIDVDDMQGLIDNIVNWYELKYPERELELNEGILYTNFKDIKNISGVMDVRQLMYRLPHKQLCLLECDYRANGGVTNIYDEDGNVIGHKPILFMKINKKGVKDDFSNNKTSYFLLHADTDSGLVDIDHNLKNYVGSKNITLDNLLVLFKQEYNKELKFEELEECILNHNCDLELRKRVLQLVSLKLIYSKNTTPERGYERAKFFVKEFNEKLDLNLTINKVEEIMDRNYEEDVDLKIKFEFCIEEDDGEYFDEYEESEFIVRIRKAINTVFKK